MSSQPQPQPVEPESASTPIWMVLVGWIFTLLPIAGLLFSAFAKLTHYKPPDESLDIGWPVSIVTPLAYVEIACAFLYLFPRTAVLGAILLTGYLGGATAAHVRIGDFEHFFFPIIMGVLVWLGLFFRDARVRALVPIRSSPAAEGGVAFAGVFATIGFAVLGLIVALLGIAAVVAGVAAMQPAEYEIKRSITIDAPPETIFPEVNDFHNWDKWSPWLKVDPNAKPTFEGPSSGTGAIFRWAGNNEVGEGSMTILESVPNKEIKIKLEFLKPFADTANTDFTFVPDGNKTVVTWSMRGTRDFMGKAMCVLLDMETMVGGKYDEGLANLKAVVEKKK